MRDFAIHDHPGVAAQLARIEALSVPQGRLGLDAVRGLLARLGDPHLAMPPVFHVAGTNGKGSTCAFLRAMLEAQGFAVHAFTSPHLVRYNERIRLAGALIGDDALAALLAEVLDVCPESGDHIGASFFEVTTAAAFLAFARTPADACVIEVGLGGRFDATNVIEAPAVCGIASLGIDHEAFLLAPEEGTPTIPIARIAFEKAGIAKSGVPLVTQHYCADARNAIAAVAAGKQADWIARDDRWHVTTSITELHYRDAAGTLDLPLPVMAGQHQASNAALAVAMLRHQTALDVGAEAMAQGIRNARWPARMQQLGDGPLTALLPARAVWLDGGHNPDAGAAIAQYFMATSNPHPAATTLADARQVSLPSRMREGLGVGQSEKIHLAIGMLANKDPRSIIALLAGRIASITALPVPGHDDHPPRVFADQAAKLGVPFYSAATVPDALAHIASTPPGDVLIAGSLYLAGEVLRANQELPA